MKIALIPSYEPDEKLVLLTHELYNNGYEIIVINDGSNKEYDKYFNECLGNVISYKYNRGKGYALKKGLRYINKHYKNYVVVTMDCDGQHTTKDANKLVKACFREDDKLILGSRRRGKNTPLRSYLGNFITRFIYRAVTSVDIYDTQTGLRCFSDKLMDYMLSVSGDRYEYEMNVLLGARDNNIKLKEVWIQTIYEDNNRGSHFNTLKDSFKIYKEIIKFSLSSIFSFVIDYVLFVLFNFFTLNTILSNVMSRIISSSFNYNVNKKIVFKSNSNSIIKYFGLALLILILNTSVLYVLSNFVNTYLAKIITELIMFFFSYFVQKNYIFEGDDK
ncbi:MAG: bifunctional glycosyltransferase family 2/GtrA family protein [Bacilli bacterium]|nr:bifunctional glycosyltransferase family 2/GtrA family protein [Bacilli bacterium]